MTLLRASGWMLISFFLLTNNICAELTAVLANMLADPLSGFWGSQAHRGELVWSWQAQVHTKPWQSRVIQLSCPLVLHPVSPLSRLAEWHSCLAMICTQTQSLPSVLFYRSLFPNSFWQPKRVGTALPFSVRQGAPGGSGMSLQAV